ncbi:DUF6230 family protein [Streptomyces sp. NPDC056600]|uniref:DUF6230 family protein n=1 Tax=Streptomyces sp. NPDC056600 TaxID=3345874 RepID=UPI0036D19B26
MSESAMPLKGRVRLRRWAALGVPGVLATAALVVATAQGILAAQFTISGMPFTINADKIQATGMAQYGGLDNMHPDSPLQGDTGGQVAVFVTTMKNAEITNLCQAVAIGGTHLTITAGNKGTPAKATNLATDSDTLTGRTGTFTGLEMGRDAATLDKGFSQGPLGTFGMQADKIVLEDVYQHNWATTAGAMTLPNLKIAFSEAGCGN